MAANNNVTKVVKLGVLAAVSIVLAATVHFPIFPAISFIEYDMGDVPIVIGALAYGPWWGLALTVVTAIIQGVTVSAASGGPIGILMHILSTGSGVLAATLVYNRHKSKKGAVISLLVFVPAVTLTMLICNYFLTPLYMVSPDFSYRAAQQKVVSLMGFILLINLIKCTANAVFIYFLYKPMSRYFLKHEFFRRKKEQPGA